GLPVVNFTRGGTVIAQARATALAGSTTLTVPYPTQATSLTPNMPGLEIGRASCRERQQIGRAPTSRQVESITFVVHSTRGVNGITPNASGRARPPSSFTMCGAGFANSGFGLPVVNFVRNGTLIAQARATGLSGSTTLTVPFPTQATSLTPNMPGLSAGTGQAPGGRQTGGAATFRVVGSVTLTHSDHRRV